MARPRYGAAKRAREIKKQEERARKLARKHGRAAAKAAETTGGAEIPLGEMTAPTPEPAPQG
jgi:hypothetical protein